MGGVFKCSLRIQSIAAGSTLRGNQNAVPSMPPVCWPISPNFSDNLTPCSLVQHIPSIACQGGSLLELDVVEYRMLGKSIEPGAQDRMELASYIGDGKVGVAYRFDTASYLVLPPYLLTINQLRSY